MDKQAVKYYKNFLSDLAHLSERNMINMQKYEENEFIRLTNLSDLQSKVWYTIINFKKNAIKVKKYRCTKPWKDFQKFYRFTIINIRLWI